MRRIVINMQNNLFCDAIAETLRRSDCDFYVHRVEKPEKIVDECRWTVPYALLMEVTGYPSWKLEERVKICGQVKAQHPECKIVLIVDENAEKEVANQVKQAKKAGVIDQFIYGSISASYLTAIVDCL